MVSYRALPLATGAGIAVIFFLAVFIQETMIVGLLKGVPLTLFLVLAGLDAVFDMSNSEGIDEVAFTLDGLVTLTSRAPVIR